jgi:hypothetical protein
VIEAEELQRRGVSRVGSAFLNRSLPRCSVV